MSSLTGRLSWGLVASLVAVFGLQWAILVPAVGKIAEDQMVTRLEHDAEDVLTAITFLPDGNLLVMGGPIDPIYERPLSGHYFVIWTGKQRLRSRSLWDEDLTLTRAAADGRLHIKGPEGESLLVYARTYLLEQHPVTLAMAEDLSHVRADVSSFQIAYGGVCLLALAVLIAGQRRVVTVTLRPLMDVRRDVAALERGEIDRVRETVPDEVRPLVREVNTLLAAMGRRVERSRAALGNLAHALKTPLTLLTQTAARSELSGCPELQETLGAETRKIGTLIERELKRARLAGAARPGRRVPVAEALGPLVVALHRLHGEKRLDIAVRADPEVRFPGDPEDMMELFGNLMDNACKWASHRVRVTATENGGLTVEVEDDGPGASEADLERLAQRGVRLDEAAPGHGLGLSIVRDVAASYGGEVRFGRSDDLGGFLARVRIPPATSAPA
jgi:signal transduction histidine kinase